MAKRKNNHDPYWMAMPDNARAALRAGWANGVPPLSSALYGRWWQLESWLRTLLYVELRAKLGSAWVDALPKLSETRRQSENEFQYMATPDAQNRLAYADASALFKMILEHWELFENSLLSKNVWSGRTEELLAIRNRIGHCRRPHSDDLIRLEQTLRDLERGALAAITSFNDQRSAMESWKDAVANGWVREQHETAIRLIKHAERQYDTTFQLEYSRRPWAPLLVQPDTISGVAGYIWHASWYFRGGRSFNLDSFWRDIEPHHDLIFLVCADSPSSISVSFSAMDNDKAIADAIGDCFDAALYSIGRGPEEDFNGWQNKHADLDPRVHVLSPWASVDESMRGISIFDA
jgi:hypothetical protein